MANGRFSSLSVLVADSSPYVSNLVASMLRTLGIREIREANDARAVATELGLRTFNVLMIDDDLPDLDGVEVTRRLRGRQGDPNRHLPVIMMASAPDAARIATARDAGINEFLRKPFAANHIEARLLALQTQPRPFIEAETYAGPDRRRRKTSFEGGDKRVAGE